MHIGLIVIATGRYRCFIAPLIESVRTYFFSGAPDPSNRQRDITVFLLAEEPHPDADKFCRIEHEHWPGPTLHRYRHMLRHADVLERADYLYYVDVDTRCVGKIGEEILGDLVATIHPGFYNQPLSAFTYERNPRSRAFIPSDKGQRYYCGGFQGGRTNTYLAAAAEMDAAIIGDERDGITAIWHDESHWNRYLLDHPPTCELSPSYCFPENWTLPFESKLLALDKCHSALRT